MAAILAILAALVACSSAAGASHNSRRETRAVYEWAAYSNLNRKFFNPDNTYLFVTGGSQRLTYNLEIIKLIHDVTVDLQVLVQGKTGSWEIAQFEQDAELNTENTPEIITAYGVLLGLKNSKPAVISQTSKDNGQSESESLAGSDEAAIVMARTSSYNQGNIFLEDFRPTSSQISRMVGFGRQFVQFTFKNKDQKILITEFIVNISR